MHLAISELCLQRIWVPVSHPDPYRIRISYPGHKNPIRLAMCCRGLAS